MFSRSKDKPYPAQSAISGASTGGGWRISTVSILILMIVFSACLFVAYYLGLRAGKTAGLELAHENSLAQVIRMPVSRAVYDKQVAEVNRDQTSDIYKQLAKTKQDTKDNNQQISEPSKEVKELLKPTATASALLKQQDQVTLAAEPTIQLAKGKQENVEAIRDALEQLNPKNQNDSEMIPDGSPSATDSSPSVRVINPQEEQQQSKKLVEEQSVLNQQEDFLLEKKNTNLLPTSTPKTKPTIKPTATAVQKKTAVAVKTPVAQNLSKKLSAGWYSQVAAPKSLKEAQTVANNLKKSGFKAMVESAQVGDQQYYRVVVGPESSRLAAEQSLARLRKQSSLKAEPFVRLVR